MQLKRQATRGSYSYFNVKYYGHVQNLFLIVFFDILSSCVLICMFCNIILKGNEEGKLF